VAEKIDRKQLKKPDEFQLVAGKAMGWVAAHQGKVFAALGAAVVAVLIGWAVGSWRSSREANAGTELAKALELESRPVGAAAQGQEGFASKEERDKAVLAALDKVQKDYGNTTAARTALAEIGFHKLKQGDAAGAQKDLQDFLSGAGRDHPLRPFAQEALGYAFEAQKKFDEAKDAFGRLRDLGLPARADYQDARLALAQGKPDAKQQLEKVAREYPKEMDVVRAANERLELASLPPVTPGEAAAQPEQKAQPDARKPQGKKKK
jgi:tetratricopeptide (TPR) repeat protein